MKIRSLAFSISNKIAREDKSSKIRSVSLNGKRQALEEVNGRIGNLETKSAPCSDNNSLKISFKVSQLGAPCGILLIRLLNSYMPPLQLNETYQNTSFFP